MFVQPSFDKVIPLSFLDVGLADLVSIYSDLCQLGTPPPVIDADDLQRNPEVSLLYYKKFDKKLNYEYARRCLFCVSFIYFQATLRGLCHDLDIPFQASMLK